MKNTGLGSIGALLALGCLVTGYATGCCGPHAAAPDHAAGAAEPAPAATLPPPPVAPPSGFRWELNAPYSDEFSGTELDRTKWNDHYPGWEGRVPGLFVPESLSVKDGMLHIKSTVLDPPRGDEGQWTIACGAIQSRQMGAHYGYYEARIKASHVSTSTTFWLKNERNGDERPFAQTELDIVEAIGNAQKWPGFADQMFYNTHTATFPAEPGVEPKETKEGGWTPIGGRVHEAFHTYGAWWVDANTIHFYLDGKRVATVNPPTTVRDTPFDQPMFVNAVCEIYTWEVAPLVENLLDDTRNTSRYDYIRAWRLVPAE